MMEEIDVEGGSSIRSKEEDPVALVHENIGETDAKRNSTNLRRLGYGKTATRQPNY